VICQAAPATRTLLLMQYDYPPCVVGLLAWIALLGPVRQSERHVVPGVSFYTARVIKFPERRSELARLRVKSRNCNEHFGALRLCELGRSRPAVWPPLFHGSTEWPSVVKPSVKPTPSRSTRTITQRGSPGSVAADIGARIARKTEAMFAPLPPSRVY
jgi:hypothetical protein